MVTSLVESLCWTVVVPLPAIMELDGLALNVNPLGEAAKAAVAFVVSHVRSHADLLKVQISVAAALAKCRLKPEPQSAPIRAEPSHRWSSCHFSRLPRAS
jgi:hypothetical protein